MKATIPAPAAALLDFVSGPESGGNYLAYYGHAKNKDALPPTVGAVLAWQRGLKFSACGRYQIILKTLEGLCKEYGIGASEPFTPDLQDELGFYLLVGRGYDHWIAGSLSDSAFADAISQEWASMPYHTGKSYYDGDGVNHSLVSRVALMTAVAKAKNPTSTKPVVETVATPPAKEPPMTTTPAATTTAKAPDFFESMIQTAENYATQIESAIKVVVSPNNNITVSSTGNGAVGGVFSSIGEAQTCISDIMSLVEDAKAGKVGNAVHDAINFAQNLFTILANFGVSIPGLTFINSALTELDPVKPAATA